MSTNKSMQSLFVRMFFFIGGGIPMFVTAVVGVVVLTIFAVFTINNLRLKNFWFFHRKMFGYPSKDKFTNWMQRYFTGGSLGEFFLLFLYFALSIVWFLFPLTKSQIMEFSFLNAWTNATGRIAMFNALLVCFPAHRLSILKIIFGVGIDDTIKFHKMIGTNLLLCTIVHFTFAFIEALWNQHWYVIIGWGKGADFLNQPLPGTIAGIALACLIITSSLKIRQKYYTVFYYVHITFSIVFVVFLAMHRNEVYIRIICFAVLFTICDFLFRLLQLIAFRSKIVDFEVIDSLQILKLEIEVPFFPRFWVGQCVWVHIFHHSFIFNSHPFTLSATSMKKNIVLHIKKRGSWTQKLFNLAKNHPERMGNLKVGITGPYCTPFEYDDKIHDQVVLVGEGSTGVILFAVLRDMELKNCESKVKCFLMMRSMKYLKVFKNEIEEFTKKGKLDVWYLGSGGDPYSNNSPEKMKAIEINGAGAWEKHADSGIKKGAPDFGKEFDKFPGKTVGILVMGGDNLVNRVKRDTYHLNFTKNLHFHQPVYQM